MFNPRDSMSLYNTPARYGTLAQCFHWFTAIAFVAAYIVIYYALWFVGSNKNPAWLPTLNVHWVLGLLIGAVTIPRLVWKLRQVAPEEVPGTELEHFLARWAHRLLYAILIIMPITGYLGTRLGTDFGLFYVPSFKDTALFGWIAATWNATFKEFEVPLDVVHHFVGKWVASAVVVLHIGAALVHHVVRRDETLRRMLPRGNGE